MEGNFGKEKSLKAREKCGGGRKIGLTFVTSMKSEEHYSNRT
jgi:hypothetical protein